VLVSLSPHKRGSTALETTSSADTLLRYMESESSRF